MDRSPSLQLILETAWRLFIARGWIIFWVMLITAIPVWIHTLLVHFDVIPSVFSLATQLAGERPKLTSSGWFALAWYSQTVLFVRTIMSVVLFGWLQAISIIACCVIAIRWRAGNQTSFAQIGNALPAKIAPVWSVHAISLVGAMIASTAFIIPGLALNALWYVAGFVAASERLGPIQSLKASASLTLRFWWGVFVIVCTFSLMTFGLGYLLSRVFLPVLFDSGIEPELWAPIMLSIRITVNFLSDLLGIIFVSAVFLVLKRAKSGPSRDELDEAFA